MDQPTQEFWNQVGIALITIAGSITGSSVMAKRTAAKRVEGLESEPGERKRFETEFTHQTRRLDRLEKEVPERDHKIRSDFNAPFTLQTSAIAALEVRMTRSEADIRDQDGKTAREVQRLEGQIERGFRELNRKLDSLSTGHLRRSTDEEGE